jgi:hypothetical protein
MSDSFTEVTTEGLGSRLMGAIKGVVIGLALFLLAFPVLFWNEGRAVKRHLDLESGAGSVVSIDASRVDPAHDGRLVHVTGRAETDEVLEDPGFGVAVNAIHLMRIGEMYQWVEDEEERKERQVGGSEKTVTTYTYTKEWSEEHWDSADFREPVGHQNPAAIPYESTWDSAEEVRLGAFALNASLVDQMDGSELVTPPAPPEGAAWELRGEGIYVPASPAGADGEPQVGDMRIRFEAIVPGDVSVVALQYDDGFTAWTGPEGSTVENLAMGVQSSEQMFAALESQNRMFTWILRGVGFLMMAFGLSMLFAPFAVAADVIPVLGDLLRLGTGLFAGVVAAALSLTTIAVGWVAYRPLVGVPLLLLAIGALVFLLRAGRARREAGPGPEAAAAPVGA